MGSEQEDSGAEGVQEREQNAMLDQQVDSAQPRGGQRPAATEVENGPGQDASQEGVAGEDTHSAERAVPAADFDDGDASSWSRERLDRAAWRAREYDVFDVRADRTSKYAGGILAEGNGNLIAGRDAINQYFDLRPSDARAGALAPEWVESAMATYVSTPSRDRINAVLHELGVVLLTGAAGSGRFRTSCHVLAQVFGVDRIVELDLEASASLNVVSDQTGLLREKYGHILELTGAHLVTRSKLAAISERARLVGSLVVIIGDPELAQDPTLQPYVVRHENPAALDVLYAHLVHRLRDEACVGDCLGSLGDCTNACTGPFVQRCVEDRKVVEYLATGPVASDVADLARRLILVHHRGKAPGEAIQLLYGRLRTVAFQAVSDLAPDSGTSGQNRQSLRRLAFRVAYATLYESPLRIVFAAADKLYHALSTAARPNQTPLAPQPLDGSVRDLLYPQMIIDGRRDGERDDDDVVDGSPQLIDVRLANAMLDVLWNDYSEFRPPLLEWTLLLGTHERDDVRRRAASVCALFGRWDVHQVYRALIAPWASAPGWRPRHTAAYAMAVLAVEPSLTSWVRRQVADWSNARRITLNDTAARTYAELHGISFTEDVLPNLRRIAARPELTASFAVPMAVSTLAEQEPKALPAILATLVDWTEQPVRGLHVQASRSVLYLAGEQADRPDEQWPRLLLLAEKDPPIWNQLRTLWSFALSGYATNVAAWRLLLEWLRAAEGSDEQANATVRFAHGLFKEPPLLARARFYVWQWRNAQPDLTILLRLLPRDED